MSDQPRRNLSLVSGDGESSDTLIRTAATEVALALGLIRVLTLLPLYDGTLDEVEHHLAAGWESLLQLQRLLRETTESGARE
jgi:hypothetical protein